MSEPRDLQTPAVMRPWNNQARMALPMWTKIWLGVLVLTFLASAWFVKEHVPARWVLGGFILSHLIVFAFPLQKKWTMRAGMVSLLHVLCWSPGWVMCILDADQWVLGAPYTYWCYDIIVLIGFSFIFDVRDALVYLACLIRR